MAQLAQYPQPGTPAQPPGPNPAGSNPAGGPAAGPDPGAAAGPVIPPPPVAAAAEPIPARASFAELAKYAAARDARGERPYVEIKVRDVASGETFTVIRQVSSVYGGNPPHVNFEAAQLTTFPDGRSVLGAGEKTLDAPVRWSVAIGPDGRTRDSAYVDMGLIDREGDTRLFEVVALGPFTRLPPPPAGGANPAAAPARAVPDNVTYTVNPPRREGEKFTIGWQAAGPGGDAGRIVIPRQKSDHTYIDVRVAGESTRIIHPEQPKIVRDGQTVDNWVDVVKVDLTLRTPARRYGKYKEGKVYSEEAYIIVDRFGYPIGQIGDKFQVERRAPPQVQTPLSTEANPKLPAEQAPPAQGPAVAPAPPIRPSVAPLPGANPAPGAGPPGAAQPGAGQPGTGQPGPGQPGPAGADLGALVPPAGAQAIVDQARAQANPPQAAPAAALPTLPELVAQHVASQEPHVAVLRVGPGENDLVPLFGPSDKDIYLGTPPVVRRTRLEEEQGYPLREQFQVRWESQAGQQVLQNGWRVFDQNGQTAAVYLEGWKEPATIEQLRQAHLAAAAIDPRPGFWPPQRRGQFVPVGANLTPVGASQTPVGASPQPAPAVPPAPPSP